jgi:hypothetical protein
MREVCCKRTFACRAGTPATTAPDVTSRVTTATADHGVDPDRHPLEDRHSGSDLDIVSDP